MVKLTRGIKGQAIRSTTEPLTDFDLRLAVPSIFAVDAHESRSERFAPIATIEVLNGLRQEGFFPFFAVQSNSQDENKRDYTKHMLRLRQANNLHKEDSNEIILVNANDGTSSYQLLAGKFRFVCQNGLVMGDINNNIRIYHKGTNIISDVIESANSVLNKFEEIDYYEQKMRTWGLTRKEQSQYAFATMLSLYGADYDKVPYKPESLLLTRRYDDQDKDMWTTFNVVQENLIRGGVKGFNTETGRKNTTREVKSIDKNLAINSAVWTVAKVMTDNMPVLEY